MSSDQEKVKIKQTLANLESDFLKSKRIFEERDEELLYGYNQANRMFDNLVDSTSYYLRKFEIEDHEFQSAISIIEENKEELLVEIKQEQRKLESAFEE